MCGKYRFLVLAILVVGVLGLVATAGEGAYDEWLYEDYSVNSEFDRGETRHWLTRRQKLTWLPGADYVDLPLTKEQFDDRNTEVHGSILGCGEVSTYTGILVPDE